MTDRQDLDQHGFGVDGRMSNDPYDRPDQAFPRLPAENGGRVTQYGRVETFDRGAYLYKSGVRGADFFLVLDGAVNILESDGYGGDVVVTTHRANEFTGELKLFLTLNHS
jgi:CRP-like cAMP-binding protein